MQASNGKGRTRVPTWAKILYLFAVALITLIAYRVGSIWFGHIVLILLTLPFIWSVAPPKRRFVGFLFAYLALTLLLATAFVVFLNDPYRSAAIEDRGLLNFLVGGPTARVLVSAVAALLVSALLLFGPILLVAWVSSEWILHMPEVYDINRRQAMQLVTSTILNTTAPYFVVEDGEIKQSKPSGVLPRLGGPGIAVVKPYHAVVFERGGKITRIEGSGAHRTERFEFVKGIVELRKQWLNFTAETVLTKDNVPLTFHCGVGFQIEPQWETARRVEAPGENRQGRQFTGVIEGDYPVYRRTIYRAVFNTTAAGWKLSSQGATETQLRKTMRDYRLEDLYRLADDKLTPDASVINQIEEQVSNSTRPILQIWGASLNAFSIKSFEAPDDVKGRLLEMWAARYASRTQIISAEGSRDAELARWQGQEDITIREIDTERRRIIQMADAQRLALEAQASGESSSIREKRKAEAEARAEQIRKEAEAELEAAVKRAEARAAAGEGERRYRIAIGKGEAEAKAELFRQILNSLYPGGAPLPIDKETLQEIARQLSSRVGTEDAIRYLGALASGRRSIGSLPETTSREQGRLTRESLDEGSEDA